MVSTFDEFILPTLRYPADGKTKFLDEIREGLIEFFNFSQADLDEKTRRGHNANVVGEQIDGAFTFNNEGFLLEAKWRNTPTPLNDFDSFSGKIARRLENTLGLFLSISGFTEEALARVVHSDKKLVLLMDCEDLMAVFEERISLYDLLKRKRREAAQTGNVYLKFRDMMC